MSRKDGERYFALDMNVGYRVDSGPSRGDSRRRAFRPTTTSADVVRNVRFTSILLKNSQIEQLRKSRFGAHNVD
jgi:hypothetical protein